jgi:hypothetical protein
MEQSVGLRGSVNTLRPAGRSICCAHIRLYESYADELPTVPHIGDDSKV